LNSAVTVIYNRILSPAMLNEARVNFTGWSVDDVRSSKDTDFGIPLADLNSYNSGSIHFGRGYWDNLSVPPWETAPAVSSERSFELRDIVTRNLGQHSLKIGGEMRWEQDNSHPAVRPSYLFSSLFDFANDAPGGGLIQVDARTGLPTDSERHFRTSSYGLFVQDDWKPRANLTINLGLRYEYFAPLTERDGRLMNLELGPTGAGASRLVSGNPFYDPDRNNLAPRVGAAWSPQRFSNRLVVRGGFGISYDRIPLGLLTNAQTNPPASAFVASCCAPIPYVRGSDRSPFSFGHLTAAIDSRTGRPATGYWGNFWGAPADFPNPYVYRYSLEGQYHLALRLVASAGYAGQAGRKLVRVVDYRSARIEDNITIDTAHFLTPDARAHGHAMELRLTREFSGNVGIQASYRLSKSVDTFSNEFANEFAGSTARNLFDSQSGGGPADSDARHAFVLAGIWDLPFLRGRSDALGRIAGGWHVSGILTAHSGFPWTPVIERDEQSPTFRAPSRQLQQGIADPSNSDFIHGIFPGAGPDYFITDDGQPVLGRNFQRGPRYLSADLTLGKSTRLAGRTDLDFRANVFNLFNTLNLTPFTSLSPGVLVRNANFGRVDGALAGRVVELQIRVGF